MRKLLAIILTISLASPGWSAIAVDSQEASGTGHNSTTSPLTWSFTNSAGTKIVCGFVVSQPTAGSGVTMSTPTYNGTTMTNVSSQYRFQGAAAEDNVTAIYYLDSPATGSNTVSIAFSGNSTPDALGGCISFTGMGTGAGAVTTANGTLGTKATGGNITTATGNYIFAEGGWGSGEGGAAGSSFTRTYVINGSGCCAGNDAIGEYFSSTGTVKTPSFSWGLSDNWAIIAVELIAAASGTSTNGTLPLLGI